MYKAIEDAADRLVARQVQRK